VAGNKTRSLSAEIFEISSRWGRIPEVSVVSCSLCVGVLKGFGCFPWPLTSDRTEQVLNPIKLP
jgi:hypothetical protein